MLWIISVILSILWLLGMISGYTMGNAMHVLMVIAIIVLVVRESLRDEKYFSDSDPYQRIGRCLERRMVGRSRKILPKFAILSGEKISQSIISSQTYGEE